MGEAAELGNPPNFAFLQNPMDSMNSLVCLDIPWYPMKVSLRIICKMCIFAKGVAFAKGIVFAKGVVLAKGVYCIS